MKTAILAILLFLIMIFPHELGHFIVAKKCGVQVNEFAFGMGPCIWKKKKGETLYSIRLFPIGGFCAMEGEDGSYDASDENNPADDKELPEDVKEAEKLREAEKLVKETNPRAFNNKKPWQKIAVLFAGSFMNLVCAFLILTITIGIIGFTTTKLGEVSGPAKEAGLLPNDKVVTINEEKIKSWNDIITILSENGEKEIKITVKRDGDVKDFNIQPQYLEKENRYVIGITTKKGHNPLTAIKSGVVSTWNVIKLMFQSLDIIFSGEATMDDVAGPVGIVQMVGETIDYGFYSYAFLIALICVNLAVINMLPLPALDGGRIIFVLYSWITGKPVSEKVEGTVHLVGICLLLALTVIITFNDIAKIFGF